jgi:hypothetical protein
MEINCRTPSVLFAPDGQKSLAIRAAVSIQLQVGTSRCDVPARSEAKGGTSVARRVFLSVRFRRLTLRSATGSGAARRPYQVGKLPNCFQPDIVFYCRRKLFL